MRLKVWVASERPSRLTHPDLDVLASVTQAIHQQGPLGIEYHSIASGRTEREIVPFALIDNSLRRITLPSTVCAVLCWPRDMRRQKPLELQNTTELLMPVPSANCAGEPMENER